jgi:hypothetical protein
MFTQLITVLEVVNGFELTKTASNVDDHSMKEAHCNTQPVHAKAVECTIRKSIVLSKGERHSAGG